MVTGVEMLLGVSLDWLFGVEHRIFPHVLGTGEQGCPAGKPDTHLSRVNQSQGSSDHRCGGGWCKSGIPGLWVLAGWGGV